MVAALPIIVDLWRPLPVGINAVFISLRHID
jgi:hypothetical protein